MTVAVIVDSAATLPAHVADGLGIRVVPLVLTIAGEDLHDGDLPLDEVLGRLDDGVSTSSPPPGAFLAAVEEAAAAGAEAAVVLTVSAEMSATYKAARIAMQDAELDVRLLDTGTAAGGEGLVALAAGRAARDGGSVDDVVAAAELARDHVELVATVNSLDRLVAGGRLPPIAGWAGRRLSINPLFAFRRSEIKRLRPTRSREAALARIGALCRRSAPPDASTLHAAVLFVNDEADAERLDALARDAAAEVGADVDLFRGPFSNVMVVHTGPGLAGLAWWWETPSSPRS